MRTIISITEFRSMPGRFVVKCDGTRGYRNRPLEADVSGAGAAAAQAMDYAVRHGSKGYVIFGPSSVMQLIPDDMRQRA